MPPADRPLRVLLVMGRSTGGIGRHVRTLAAALVAGGHDVTVCAPAASEELFGWSATGARFRPAPVGAVRPRSALAARRALRLAAADRDVVHAHGVRAGAVTAAAGLTPPLVVTWHNGPHDRWRRRLAHPALERLVARQAAMTLTVSADLAERARRAGAGRVRTVAVVAPPLAPAATDPVQLRAELGAADRPLVVAVGRLEPQKRLDLLVRAVADWPDPPAPVVVVAGTGSLEERLRQLVEDTGAPVSLLGRRDDVAGLLAAADVVVLPSAWEGYPLVAQEALRAGTALVATAVGGVPALVGDGARLVPPGDLGALRTALRELLGDPAARHELAARGRARAAGWPSEADMVAELAQAYLDLRSRVSEERRSG